MVIRRFWLYLTAVRFGVWGVVFFAVVMISIRFYLKVFNIQVEFSLFFYEVGKLVYRVSLGIITSFIFYLIVVHTPQYEDRVKKSRHLVRISRGVVSGYCRFVDLTTGNFYGDSDGWECILKKLEILGSRELSSEKKGQPAAEYDLKGLGIRLLESEEYVRRLLPTLMNLSLEIFRLTDVYDIHLKQANIMLRHFSVVRTDEPRQRYLMSDVDLERFSGLMDDLCKVVRCIEECVDREERLVLV